MLCYSIPLFYGKLITTDITSQRKFIVHISFLRCYRWLLYGTNKNKERISRICWLFRINRRRRHRSIRKEIKIINKTTPHDSGYQQVRFMRTIVYIWCCVNKRFTIEYRDDFTVYVRASPYCMCRIKNIYVYSVCFSLYPFSVLFSLSSVFLKFIVFSLYTVLKKE